MLPSGDLRTWRCRLKRVSFPSGLATSEAATSVLATYGGSWIGPVMRPHYQNLKVTKFHHCYAVVSLFPHAQTAHGRLRKQRSSPPDGLTQNERAKTLRGLTVPRE